MKRDYLLAGLLFASALALIIAWELLEPVPVTPIPDSFRKAFDDA